MSLFHQAARPLNPLSWIALPALLCVLATILLGVPLRLWGLSLPEPVFALVPAFAWAVIRPSVLPALFLLLLGLFMDIFWGGPLGLWPLGLLAAYSLVLANRAGMIGQSGVVLWAWYAAAALTAETACLLLSMLDAHAAPNLVAVLWQYLATAALYPFAHILIQRYEDADVRFR